VPPDTHELLSRPLFDLIVNRYAEQFDLIPIDTPAATESADTQIVAVPERGGATGGKTDTRSARLQQTRKELSRIGVSIINEY
jgi:protein-tyrosine kinase